MKRSLCIIGILSALVLVKCETSPNMKTLLKECAKEVGLPEDVFQGSPNHDDPKVKCFGACILKKTESLVDDKVIIEKTIEHVMESLPDVAPEIVKADVTECANKANEQKEECDVGGAYFKCFLAKHSLPNQ